MADKPWHSRKKPCHKCEKETKLALKCEHCGAMQQWDWSDQMFFLKSLSSKWKALYAVGMIVVCYLSFTVSYSFFSSDNSAGSSKSSSRKSSSVSLCKCINSGPYYDRNTSACQSKFRSKWGSSSPSVDQMLYYCESYCGNCY